MEEDVGTYEFFWGILGSCLAAPPDLRDDVISTNISLSIPFHEGSYTPKNTSPEVQR